MSYDPTYDANISATVSNALIEQFGMISNWLPAIVLIVVIGFFLGLLMKIFPLFGGGDDSDSSSSDEQFKKGGKVVPKSERDSRWGFNDAERAISETFAEAKETLTEKPVEKAEPKQTPISKPSKPMITDFSSKGWEM